MDSRDLIFSTAVFWPDKVLPSYQREKLITPGIHDLRFCCADQRALLRRYDVPPFPRPRLGGSNRITHAVYNDNGTEILINTRTIGLLLRDTDNTRIPRIAY